MARSAAIVAIIIFMSLVAGAALANEALTPEDYQWLAANLTIAHNSPALQDLTEAQKSHLHALIGNSKATIDQKRQETTEFLTGVTGDSLENSLTRSEQ